MITIVNGCLLRCALQLCELSTPFLHIRWFMSKLGKKATLAYTLNGLAFAVSFLSVRGVLMTVMFYRVWAPMPNKLYHEGCAPCTVVMTCAWAFQALQYIWCYKVAVSLLSFMKSGSEVEGSGKGSGHKGARKADVISGEQTPIGDANATKQD